MPREEGKLEPGPAPCEPRQAAAGAGRTAAERGGQPRTAPHRPARAHLMPLARRTRRVLWAKGQNRML